MTRLSLVCLASACAPLASDFIGGAAPVRVDCWPGFTAAMGSTGCEALVPASDCPPGTMPLMGSPTCQSVGVPSCPAGFATDPSGWGCIEVAATGCAAPLRPRLGDA